MEDKILSREEFDGAGEKLLSLHNSFPGRQWKRIKAHDSALRAELAKERETSRELDQFHNIVNRDLCDQIRVIYDTAETMHHELWCETLKHPDKDVDCNCIRGKVLKMATPGAVASGIGLKTLRLELKSVDLLLTLERQESARLREWLEAARKALAPADKSAPVPTEGI